VTVGPPEGGPYVHPRLKAALTYIRRIGVLVGPPKGGPYVHPYGGRDRLS